MTLEGRNLKLQGLNGRVKVRQHDARIVKGVLLLMKEDTRHIGEGRGKQQVLRDVCTAIHVVLVQPQLLNKL